MAHLPDPVMNEIIRRVTTETAVCMSFVSKQWQDMLPSLPKLDFDDGPDHRFDTEDDDFVHQHKKFTNTLQYYLRLCDKDQQAKKSTPLDKFRLRMTRYSSRYASMVYKLLSCSIERGVKELDISLGGFTVKNYYYLCRTNLLNAKTLTTLNLEYVRMKSFDRLVEPIDYSISLRLLPSLKTMSLKNVHFDPHALLFFVWECPYIEHLSLASCSFEFPAELQLTSLTLKSIEILECSASKVELYAQNLESLTIVSSDFPLTCVLLRRCLELKHVNIYALYLKHISFLVKSHGINAIIDAPALHSFNYSGYLVPRFSFRAPNLYACSLEALDEELLLLTEPLKHFHKLKDLFQQFGDCKEMTLWLENFEDLIFPEDFKKSLASPILPNLESVELGIRNPPTYESYEQELKDSLYWMAPAMKYEPSYV